MSKFAENNEKRKEREQRAWEARKEKAKLCFDLCKLFIAGMVIVELTFIHSNSADGRVVIIGTLYAGAFYLFGTVLLNKHK